jgi:hypothetical protein
LKKKTKGLPVSHSVKSENEPPEIEDGGPAFPNAYSMSAVPGMSLRDYFAASALQGYASSRRLMDKALDDWDQNGGRRPICVADFFAGLAYEVADAMLKARET